MFNAGLPSHLGEFTATAGGGGVKKYKSSQLLQDLSFQRIRSVFLEKLFYIGNEWSTKI